MMCVELSDFVGIRERLAEEVRDKRNS